jgi:hypothetical protein
MAKFHFSFQRAAGAIAQDDEGQDLLGLEEAKATAQASAREMLANDVKFASSDALIAVVITNEAGQELARIAAKDVLPESLK